MVDEIIGHNLIRYYMLMKMFYHQKMLEQDDHHELLAKEIEYPGDIRIISIRNNNTILTLSDETNRN